eukprot:11779510-Ditylum_brightwellii.AAC.1
MLTLSDAPGSDNGTGLMQTLAAFAIRELYESKKAANKKVASSQLREDYRAVVVSFCLSQSESSERELEDGE